MGTSTSMIGVANKIDKVQAGFDGRALRKMVERVGQKTKPIATRAISPSSLSHWGRGRSKGKSVKAKYKVTDDHRVELVPTPAALAALLELGSYKAQGVWKAPKRKGSARRKRGTVGRYTRGQVPGREAWSKARPPVEAAAPVSSTKRSRTP